MAKAQSQAEARSQQVRARIISGVAITGLIFIVAYVGSWLLFLAILGCVVVGLHELYGVLTAKGYHPLLPLGMALGAFFVINAQFDLRLVVVVTAILLATAISVVLPHFTRYTYADLALTIAGAIYLGLLFSYAILIRALPGGREWLLIVWFGVGAADVSAYVVGSLFGKHKLAPRISPNKTWEGVIGGTVGCFLTMAFLNLFFSILSWWFVPVFAVIVSACDILGGLLASAVKRSASVKDYSHLIPGHGGLLDRIDGVLLALPVAYWIIVLVTG